MPIKRPLIGKTLLRDDIQKKLFVKMNSTNEDITSVVKQFKIMSHLFDKCVTTLKKETLDDFFAKQGTLVKDLDKFHSFVGDLRKGLDTLRENVPSLVDLLDAIDPDEIAKDDHDGRTNGVVTRLVKLSLNNDNVGGKTNGNGHDYVDRNGQGSISGESKGSISLETLSNSSTSTYISDEFCFDLIIDPLDYQPIPPLMPTERPLRVLISYIYTPSDFFIHPYNGQEDFIMKVQKEQNKLIEKGITGFSQMVKGMYCCARYSQDLYFYRAKVIGINYKPDNKEEIESVRVFFIDYGNIEDVPPSYIMPMSKNIADQKLGAVNCSLAHYFPENGIWSKDCCERLKEKGSGIILCYFRKQSPAETERGTFPLYPVELFDATTEKSLLPYIINADRV